MLEYLARDWGLEEEDVTPTREGRAEDARRRLFLEDVAAADATVAKRDTSLPAESDQHCLDVHPDGPGVGGD
jgi:hypothetical protein